MGREKVLDFARHLDVPVRDEHEVIGDPLQLARTCDERTTETPSSAAAVITVAMKSFRASGSRLARGSSRMRSSGRRASASVKATWACWPPDILPAFWRNGMPSSLRRRSA